MVTARDGRPSLVTSSPLTAPSTTPRSRHSGRISSSGSPANHSLPMTALDSPTVLATERSISPVMITRVSGRAISMITTTSSSRNPALRVEANPSTVRPAITRNATSTRVMTPSPVPSRRSREAAGPSADVRGAGAGAVSTATEVPPSQAAGQAQGERPVQDDRGQDERAHGGVAPEGADAELRQRGADGREQERAERRAVDRSAATEDRHAADDAGGDHGQFLPRAGRGVQGLEPRCVEHAGQAGEGTVDDECGEDPPSHRDAGQPGGLWFVPDAVQLPPAAVVAQAEADQQDHDERHEEEHRDAEQARTPERLEAVREVRGVDLQAAAAACPEGVQAPEDVQGAERDHQRRHLGDGDDGAVERAADRADRHAREYDEHDRCIRRLDQQRPRRVGGQTQHRADREVDVAGDDHDGLAGGEDGDDRGREEQVAEVLRRQEARVGDLRDHQQQEERSEDAHLPHRDEPLHERSPAAPGVRGGTRLRRNRGRLVRGRRAHGATAVRSPWPVAASMTLSSSARARGMSSTRRPSCMTRTRSAMPSTSGSSLETMTTARPSAASPESSRWTSALVPTSMPRVGSSTMSTRGSVDSHLASTTFCWLPPDRVDTGSDSFPALTCSFFDQAAAVARSRRAESRPRRESFQRRVSVALRSTDSCMTSPCWRRSSGTRAMPAAIAAAGLPPTRGRPSTRTSPVSCRSMPNTARITSDRPAPTSPARATISPP